MTHIEIERGREKSVVSQIKALSIYLSIYGSIALCWALAAFSVS
jgi:hypothetical protein